MNTIITKAPSFYAAGYGGASNVVGWESRQSRVVRYEFTTTSMGVSSLSWSVNGVIFQNGSDSGGLLWYIGSSDTSHSNAGMNSESTGVVNINAGTASGSADIILQPNTTYYLWIFPASDTFGWWYWSTNAITVEVVGAASTLSLSISSVNVGETITANIGSNSSSFTHTVEFYINSEFYYQYTDVVTEQSFVIPTEWYDAMPTTTSCVAYCRVTTYNGDTQIGDTIRKAFDVKVPSNVVPVVGDISLIPTIINGNYMLVKGKNSLAINVTGCIAGYGSTISNYLFVGPSILRRTNNASTSVASVSESGNLTYTVTVTDARGRTASKSATIYCYDYYAPGFASFNAYRADADGMANANGTYLKCVYEPQYAPVNNTNIVTVHACYNDNTLFVKNGESLIDLNGDVDTTYNVHFTISDIYGGSNSSAIITIFGSTRIFNITSDGTGVAIGKMAESGNLFECRWDAKFDGAATGPSGFSTSSDARVKKNIQDIDIDIVDRLRPVQYELVQAVDGKVHYGFVAQEVENLLSTIGIDPSLIGVIGQIANNGRQEYVLTYTEFIPLLTKKCQDLQRETNLLRQEIEELKKIIKI